MTVPVPEQLVFAYDGDGSTTVFAYPVRFLGDAELLVILQAYDGSQTFQALSSDYTVSGAEEPNGGSITMAQAPASGDKLYILRGTKAKQLVDMADGQRTPAKSTENQLDRLTMALQDIDESDRRSFKAAVGGSGKTLDVLPKGHFWLSDANGNMVDGGSAEDIAGAQDAAATALAARDMTLAAVPNVFPANLAALKAIDTDTHVAADVRPLGPYFWQTGDHTDTEDGYAVVKADDTAITAGAWVRRFDRLPRPQDFGGTDRAAIQRASTYAAREVGAMEFSGAYTSDLNIDLESGVEYSGVDGAVIDGSARTDTVSNDYGEGILQASPGTIGDGVSLASFIAPTFGFSITELNVSSGTATATTASPHGLAVGSYVWVLYPSAGNLMPDGGGYYISQAPSTETMGLTVPFVVTAVSDTTHFSYAVDEAATSLGSVSGFYGTSNHLQIKTSTAHGAAAGDTLMIWSDAKIVVPAGDQNVYQAEKLHVSRVIDTTTLIVSAPPRMSYSTSDNAKIAVLSMGKATKFRKLEIVGRGSTGTTTVNDGDSAIGCDLIDDVLYEDVTVRDCERISLCAQRYNSMHFNRCRVFASFADEGGRISGVTKRPYGMVYGGANDSTLITQPFVRGNVRHGIVEASPQANGGYSQEVTIIAPDIRGTLNDCIANHFPNEGYSVIGGGYLSSRTSFGINSRTGDLHVEGVRGSGGRGLVNAYGHLDNVKIKDVRGDNYLGDIVYINPQSDANLRPTKGIVIDGVYGSRVRRGVLVQASTGAPATRSLKITNVFTETTEYEAVRVSLDTTDRGKVDIETVYGTNVCTGQSTKAVVTLSHVNGGRVRDVDGSASSSLMPVWMTNDTIGVYLEDVPNQPTSATIASGEIILTRRDDYSLRVSGEGATADNLDKITGLNPGQSITIRRFSEAITIRDTTTSGVSGNDGGIQTPNGDDVVLDGPYKHAVIYGQPNSAGTSCYPVVQIVRTDLS